MRSTLNARSATLVDMPKGALFLLKRYSSLPMFGVKLSGQGDDPDGKPTILLLNPDFGRSGEANWHRIFQWDARAQCVSFGENWILQPEFSATSLSDINDPQDEACLTIGPEGVYFRAALGECFRASYRQFVHVDTLDTVKDLGNTAFHLTGYRIYLNRDDRDNRRPPIYKRGTWAGADSPTRLGITIRQSDYPLCCKFYERPLYPCRRGHNAAPPSVHFPPFLPLMDPGPGLQAR